MGWKVKKLKDFEAQLNKKEKEFISAYNHPHYGQLKYYPHKVGLTRPPRHEDLIWLNEHTQARYSTDFTIAPFNISFENAADAVLFKLTFGGTLACAPHKKI